MNFVDRRISGIQPHLRGALGAARRHRSHPFRDKVLASRILKRQAWSPSRKARDSKNASTPRPQYSQRCHTHTTPIFIGYHLRHFGIPAFKIPDVHTLSQTPSAACQITNLAVRLTHLLCRSISFDLAIRYAPASWSLGCASVCWYAPSEEHHVCMSLGR